jgi:hypothetical protein
MDDSGVAGTAQLEQLRRKRRIKLTGGPSAAHSRSQSTRGLDLQRGTFDGLLRGDQKSAARRAERTYHGPLAEPRR